MKREKGSWQFLRIGLLPVLLLTVSLFSVAQNKQTDKPIYGNGAAFARITVLEGSATVTRDSAGDMNVTQNFIIEPLDILSTGGDGRAVIQFIDGTLLKLDRNTRVEFLEIGSSDNGKTLSVLARLWNGAILSDVSDDNSFNQRSFRIDTEDATVYFLSNGKYRLDRRGNESILRVISGSAEMSENGASTLFHSGEMGRASRGYASISKSYFNTFDMDAFDMWARNTYDRRPSASAQYVPTQIRHYVTELDSNGTWYYDSSLATYVWHPSIVDVGWEPYSYGYWAWSPFGMTWVSYYNWGFAPFHYGAWDFSVNFGWVWVPGPYYSPAWVSWDCWDSYIGWYPYNSYYYRRYHRGRRLGRYRRHHRIVYTSVNRLTLRQRRLRTREIPNGRNVVRVTRPIVPNPRQLNRNPREAIRNAVNRPITRQIIRNRQIETREQATSRITRGFRAGETRRSVSPRGYSSGTRITVRNPSTRRLGTVITRGESSRRGRNTRENSRTINPIISGNRTGRSRSGQGIEIQTPVIRNRGSFSENANSRVIRNDRGTTQRRTIQGSNSFSRSIQERRERSGTIRTPRQGNVNRRSGNSFSGNITVTRPGHTSTPIRTTPVYTRPRSNNSSRSYSKPIRTTPVYTRPRSNNSSRSYTRPTRSASRSRHHRH